VDPQNVEIKLAVYLPGYPNEVTSLTESYYLGIILFTWRDNFEPGTRPRLVNVIHESGLTYVYCVGIDTVQRVRNQIEDIDHRLITIRAEDLPQFEYAVVLPYLENVIMNIDIILDVLKRSNRQINTIDNWTVIIREDVNNGLLVSLMVDPRGAYLIRKNSNSLRFGTDVIDLKFIG